MEHISPGSRIRRLGTCAAFDPERVAPLPRCDPSGVEISHCESYPRMRADPGLMAVNPPGSAREAFLPAFASVDSRFHER